MRGSSLFINTWKKVGDCNWGRGLEKMMEGEADSKVSNLQNKTPNLFQPLPNKKKRNLPGTPDPEAEVIALSPTTLLATNRFLCEICGKGFQRDQNLQLHRRGHNLPWKLKQRSGKDQPQTPPRKRVYVCPEPSCVHHNPARALGDLTGIKKHFSRKHGEKKWKCDRCSKRYAVQSDWKAHSKTCGTREYRCDCGVLFSRRDSFITHRAFCDALAEETARTSAKLQTNIDYILQHGSYSSQHLSPNFNPNLINHEVAGQQQAPQRFSLWMSQGAHEISNASPLVSNDGGSSISDITLLGSNSDAKQFETRLKWSSTPGSNFISSSSLSVPSLLTSLHQNPASQASTNMSATALLQKAALVGVKRSSIDPFTGSSEGSLCQDAIYSAANGGKFENSMCSAVDGFAVSNHSARTDDVYFTRSKNLLKDNLGGGTRDFLGVGMSTVCPPSVNGWI